MRGAIADDRRWVLPKPVPEDSLARLTTQLLLPQEFACLLLNRGLESESEIRAFLSPSLDDLHDPFLMPDMDAAVHRIESAVTAGERILLHGDYDADGMSAVALLTYALQRLGGIV